jgi:dienelactone hydrolase
VQDLTGLKDVAAWPKMRQSIETSIQSVIGKPKKDSVDLQVKVMDELDCPGYVRRRVNYFVDEWGRVSAWMFVPEVADEKPAILCCHPRSAMGKDELAGFEGGDPNLALAKYFAERGYVTFAPDCITSGERTYARQEAFHTKSFYKEHPKSSLMGKMLADHIKCIDLLSESEDVDPARIGVLGHGLGGANALLLAAFDDRVRTVVSSCGFTRLADDPNPNRWVEDDGCELMPKLAAALKKDKLPFDWEHVLALIAPNPTLLITALNDETLPKTASCATALKHAQTVYKLLGARDAVDNTTHKGGHAMPLEALDASLEWMDRWL